MISSNRLVLGCARFSGKYGVNSRKDIGFTELRKIFVKNKKFIKEIDTAITYENANKKLSKIPLNKIRVSSKIPKLDLSEKTYETKIIKKVKNHAKHLNIRKFEVLYLHEPKQILKKSGWKVIKVLKKIKKLKLTRKIGITVYTPKELKNMVKKFKPDVVQIPINILDRRFLKSELLKFLKKKDIKIYVRSIFLQGLLVKNFSKLPGYFNKWKKIFISLKKWSDNKKLSKVETCLSICKFLPKKSKIIFGVENDIQFKDFLKSIKIKSFPPKKIFSNDEKLINPSKWTIKN